MIYGLAGIPHQPNTKLLDFVSPLDNFVISIDSREVAVTALHRINIPLVQSKQDAGVLQGIIPRIFASKVLIETSLRHCDLAGCVRPSSACAGEYWHSRAAAVFRFFSLAFYDHVSVCPMVVRLAFILLE